MSDIVLGEIKVAKEIHSWSEVPHNDYVFEDTYNELYQMKWVDGKPYIYHVGFRYSFGKDPSVFEERKLDEPRLCDFQPQCMYDQPWFFGSEVNSWKE